MAVWQAYVLSFEPPAEINMSSTPCKKPLKTITLFIYNLLQGQHFSGQEMTQSSPGLYKYRIFLFFWLIDTVQFLTT